MARIIGEMSVDRMASVTGNIRIGQIGVRGRAGMSWTGKEPGRLATNNDRKLETTLDGNIMVT
eukprot:8715156-Karenia_brevis.AAC.1